MSEKEKQVIETLETLLPKMSEKERAHLMGYGEGLAARDDRQEKSNT